MNKFVALLVLVMVTLVLGVGCGKPPEAKAAPVPQTVWGPEVFVATKDWGGLPKGVTPEVTITPQAKAWTFKIEGPAGAETIDTVRAEYVVDELVRAVARQAWGMKGRRAPVVLLDCRVNDPGPQVRDMLAKEISEAR